jgi:hypothetical protein
MRCGGFDKESTIRHPASDILHPTFGIRHPGRCVRPWDDGCAVTASSYQAGGWRLAAGGWRLEAEGWRLEPIWLEAGA